MNISEVFIRRPIATSLIMLAITLFGVLAYRGLSVSDMPNVDYPTIVVSASLPGGDPGTMASAVATPLERQFTTIAGLDSMTSSSSTGSSQIALQFNLSRNIDGAAVDVQTAIAECMPLLPAGMPAPPSFRKFNPAAFPVMFLSLVSHTMPMWKLDDYAEQMMAQRISMVEGVAQVQVFGAHKYAVRVQVDPDKLNAKQIGLDEVDAALQNWNANVPTGTVYSPTTSYNVQANGMLMDAAAFRPVIVAYRNGAAVRLDEVANVIDSVEDDKNSSWIYSKTSRDSNITLAVMRQPGANTIDVIDNIRRLMPMFQTELPPSTQLIVRGDRSKNIREAFRDVQRTMFITLALVIMVIFLFLRKVSATAIPSMALPFSILGTFAIMYVLDFSLDNMSMMALLLSIGFVVDDAIVMLENIVRHMENGEKPLQAALNGSREIGFTIVSMTLSLTAVFIPVVFMGGLLGRIFREFAVTICSAILISGLVSVTLTPMLCSRFLRQNGKGRKEKRPSALMRSSEDFFNWLHRFYESTLAWVLHHRPVMAGVFIVVLAATVYLYKVVPKGFIPDVDNDFAGAMIEAAQGTSYYQMAEYADKVARIVENDPDVDTLFASVGGGWGGSTNTARLNIQLVPRSERKESVNQVLNRIRPKLMGFPGFRVFLNVPQAIHIGGHMGKSSYEMTVSGPDTEQLYRESEKLEKVIAKIPIVQDVSTDLQMKNPRVNVEIDRDKAAAYGLNATQIESVLYDAFGPRWSSTIYTDTNQYRVLLEVDPKYQEHADSLAKIYFKAPAGGLIPMKAVTRIKEDAGPQSINHSGQLPAVNISFALKPGVSLGEAVDAIQDASEGRLPATMSLSFTGAAAAFQSSLKNLTLLLFVAIMVVYIVLGMLYESYIHPLTILSGLPAAGFGALLTLLVFHVELNIYSFVGLMMLVGIVKKNAIMQIDFALEAERKEGKSPLDAIYQGCLVRFRPIMMTTMAALLGAVPISLGWGAGGEARRPLGLAVVGGLLFSQLMTLYLTPVVYTYMAAILERWRKRKGVVAAMRPQPAVGD